MDIQMVTSKSSTRSSIRLSFTVIMAVVDITLILSVSRLHVCGLSFSRVLQGITMDNKEAKTIVEHLLDGTLQSQLLQIAGQEYILTNVTTHAMHGTSTNIESGYGLVIVRTEQLAIIGIYTQAVAVPEALQAMCEFGDDLAAAGF